MADDLWNRDETAGNVDPWAAPANALQPKRRFTLVPVDHDPWAPSQGAPTLNDGGNLSGPTARRLPGERAVAPRGTALQGPGELEDPEARAYGAVRSRTAEPPMSDMSGAGGDQWPDSHLRDTPRWALPFTPVGAGLVTAALAKGLFVDTPEAIERLMTRGYTPGQQDEQAVADAFTAAGVAGTGAFAGAAPKGSIGTFIGRRGAQNLSDAGKPTALKAIEMAERLEARGVSEGNIHAATKALIETEDPRLGIVHKGDDGAWRVEISDDKSRLRPIGPSISKLGRELTHPELYQAYPDMPAIDYLRVPGGTSYHKPGDPSEIGVGTASPRKRASTLHEVAHEAQILEDFARGGAPGDFAPGGPLAHLLRPGETPNMAYRRLAGEVEARVVADRYQLTPEKRRATPYEQSIAALGDGVAPKDKGSRIIAKGQDRESWSVGRDSDEWPSAFDQAQEKRWEDLAQRGEVGQQSMWSDMGAHLHKPGQRGGGPGPRASILWSREANLMLAQMHKRGGWPSEIATKMSDRFGKRYTEDRVASQLEALGLVGSNRKLPSSAVGEWQPDAVAILQGDRVEGMSAAQIAKLIEEETGQITTKNSVIGKLNRLRQERQRAELAEDLAKGGSKLKAAGVPAHNGDAERRRRSSSLWDRIIFWGGY